MADSSVDARTTGTRPSTSRSFYDKEVQAILWQVVILTIVIGAGYYLYSNMQYNLEKRQIKTGFDFLSREAGFEIGESLIQYSAASTYARAFIVGIVNTLYMAAIGIVLATIIGTVIGIATLSQNWLVAKLTEWYIHILRNIPVLLQIIFWYVVFLNDRFFQDARGAEPLFGDVFVTIRGIYAPIPLAHVGWTAALIAIPIAVVAVWILSAWAKRRQTLTGETFPTFWVGTAVLLGLPVIAWLVFGAPWEFESPRATRFGLRGGGRVTPEFMAVLVGLTVYTSAFIAEIVRAGILSVHKGQTEAGRALGLRDSTIMYQIILPQALRVIIPPTTSQYLNLTKNSSLA
ncbi:MAG: ABC transporter permease subunit, partial [Pseudomonadota bacterium]